MKNNNNIKTFVAVGIGAALFFVLGRFVAIPSPVPNTNIKPAVRRSGPAGGHVRSCSRRSDRLHRPCPD